MKFPLVVVMLVYLPIFSVGQIPLDSLLAVWNNQSQPDTTRLEALHSIYFKGYLYSQPDSAYHFAQLAYDFAQEKGLKKEMAIALYTQGLVSSILTNYQAAIDFQKRSLSISESIKDTMGISKSLNNLGNIYLRQSDYANAIDYYTRCLKLAVRIGSKKQEATLQNNIGLVYMDLGYYDKSLAYLNHSLNLNKELKLEDQSLNALNNIGTIYRQKKEYSTALEYYQRALSLKNELQANYGIGTIYSNIALIHRELGAEVQAKEFFDKSMAMYQQIGNKKGIARCLIHFGTAHRNTNQDSVLAFAIPALNLAQETGNIAEVRDAAELLAHSYQRRGQYQQALEMQVLYQSLKDSIQHTKNQQALFKHEFEFQVEKTKLENEVKHEQELRKAELLLQRERYTFLGYFILLFLAIVHFIRDRRQRIKQERKDLVHKMELLKERLAVQTISAPKEKIALSLDKAKIEKAINAKLGESSWMILNLIFQNPSISNSGIAEEISLSLEGVSSSLRRMYTAFDIKTSSNKRITLIMMAVRISVEE